jgi:hypothetical protein
MSQTHANRQHTERESEAETAIPSKNVDSDKIKADMDELDKLLDEALLDEIDAMIDENTTALATKFVQRGGE